MNAKRLMTGTIVGVLALAGCMSLEERLASNDAQVRREAEYELVSNSRRNGTEADRIAVINRVTDLDLLQEIAKTATPEVKHGNSVTPSTIPDGTAALAKLNDQKILASLSCAAKAKEIRIAASGKVTDQTALVAVYSAARDTEVKKVVLDKMEAPSLQKLPYSVDLIPYWAKVSDQKTLARIYRDGYAKLAENERSELVRKFTEEAVIVEMVTSPSDQERRDEEWERERKGCELEGKMKSALENAKDREERAARHKRGWEFGLAKDAEKEADEFKAKYAQAKKELNALRLAGPKWLYVTNDVARAALFGCLKQDTLVTMAKTRIEAQSFEDWNEKKKVENLKDGVVIVTKISNPKDVEELSAAVVKKICGFRKRCSKGWCHEWDAKDKQIVKDMMNQLRTKLTDDMLESIATSNPGTLNCLSAMFKDKKRVSQLAVKYLAKARATKNADKIKKAWNAYGGIITDNAVLEEIAVKENALRDAALAQIKDDFAKAHALAAIKAEQERLVALRKQKLAKVVEIAEKDAGEMQLLFSHVKINTDQKKRVRQATMGRPFYLKNVKVWDENVSAPKGTKRIMIRADLEGSSEFFMMNADFNGDYKASVKGLKNFAVTSIFGYAIQGVEYSHDIYLEAMIATGKGTNDFVAFLDEHNISDEMLDEILSQKESVTRRFAKEEELDFPASGDVSKGKTNALGEALKAAGELGQKMDEIKGVKRELGKAWAGVKSEIRKGMNDVISDKDKRDIKKSMGDLKDAAEALKTL